MGEAKYTPGPWNVSKHWTNRRGKIKITDEAGRIDTVCWVRAGRKQSAPNADLIAAAPDLYEALEELAFATKAYRVAHDTHGGDSIESGRAWDTLRFKESMTLAALAKARGETPDQSEGGA